MTAKQNRMKPRSTGVLHGRPKLKGSRGIKSAPDLTSPGGKCLDLGREDSLTTPWTCFQLSAAQEKVRVRAPPPWTPVSPPGLHSSMPTGHPERLPTQTCRASSADICTHERSTPHLPRWPQKQCFKLTPRDPRGRRQPGDLSALGKPPFPSTLHHIPLVSFDPLTSPTAPSGETDKKPKTSGQAGVWKRSPKKAWLFKTVPWKWGLGNETRLQTLL